MSTSEQQNIDGKIKSYLNNNNFISKSNFTVVGMSQLFRLDVISKKDVDVFIDGINKNESINDDQMSFVTIQNVISVNIPAERFEYITQNIWNRCRNSLVAVTRDQFRIKLIESAELGYRRSFKELTGYRSDNKNFTRTAVNTYYNLLIRPINKTTEGLYQYSTNIILTDCVTENLNDLDYSTEQLKMISCEITGKFKNLIEI